MILIGSDHAGYGLKKYVRSYLEKHSLDYEDVGAYSKESVDYPDIAEKVASEVSKNPNLEGILICRTGIGMSITANKFPNVRAALCGDCFTAVAAKCHNNANILVLGSRDADKKLVGWILDYWFSSKFESRRHQKRIEKISKLEEEPCKIKMVGVNLISLTGI